jgi:NAD(P)-dependent dehydrogenase (short-subunit alcohol dehydrogenase family)
MGILDQFSLKGKVAVVTGGAGIVGKQLVRAMAEAGAKTFVAARNVAKLEALRDELAGKELEIVPVGYDQSDESSVLALRDRVLSEAGRVDVLVNNAVLRPMKRGYEDDAATFDESMRVNGTGLFVITRAFGDAMAEGGGGSIINIGSIQGMVGTDPEIYRGTEMNGWYPDYYFHKGGMINFTRFVASYYGGRGVRCNCLSPGGVRTENHPAQFVDQYSARTFLGRLANDTDLMGAVVFFAADASAYITGTNLPVDGGYTAK